MQRLRVPGLIRPMEYRDPESGEVVFQVKTSPRYTVIVTPEREYFFVRETGKFDGIGMMSVGDPLPINHLLADGIRAVRRSHESFAPPP